MFTGEVRASNQSTKQCGDKYAKTVETTTTKLIVVDKYCVKYWSFNENIVKEYGQGGGERKDSVIVISSWTTSMWTLPFVERTFISVEEMWFWTNVTDAHRSVKDCYVGRVIYNGHINRFEESSENNKTYVEVEYGWIVVAKHKSKRCVEVYWFTSCVQAEMQAITKLSVFFVN